MSQGRKWTKDERESIIQSLKPFLEAGFSRNRACEQIGLPAQTLSNWVINDEALGIKLKGFENTLNMLALSNIADAISKESDSDDTRKETSKWYAERRMKQEFSTRTEATGAEGKDLPQTVLVKFIGDEPTESN